MRLLYVVNAEPEWIALFVLSILLIYSLADRGYSNSRTHMFRAAVGAALLSVVADILTLMCWPQAAQMDRALVYSLNAAYFYLTSLAEVLLCIYILMEIYASIPMRGGFTISLTVLLATLMIFATAIATNHLTGLLFILDEQNAYSRGWGTWLNMAILATDVMVVVVSYFLHRKDADVSFRSVMAALPVLALTMSLFQQLSPQTQLSGVIMALALLILFINCQRRRVNTDPLTGCGTREALFDQMTRFIEDKRDFTLQLVSLRSFKRINQRYGLRAGDALLRAVCREIQTVFSGDDCYRFSGADVVILHRHADNDDADAQLTRLRKRFLEGWPIGDGSTVLGASYAEIAYPTGGKTQEELINGLEYCLGQSRQQPDGTLVRFDDRVRAQMTTREHMLEAIQSGMDNDRFFLCYQPIFSAVTERLCAAEALLRLRDANGEIIPPDKFIPLAEETGVIVPLTWIVLRKVCEFLDRCRDADPPPVSINFSTQQFMDRDMCPIIRRYLDHYRIAPSQIKIEITERVFTENDALLTENVRGLSEMGVGLYLDDFGTGYSNLASVAHLPFEVVKVDRSLLTAEAETLTDTLLRAVLSGLKHMGATVLMEGVETWEQIVRVREMGAERLQGFFCSRPLEESPFLARLTDRSLSH